VVEKATLFEIIYFEEIIKNQGGRNPLLLQNPAGYTKRKSIK
jgi:hypothetical protein